MHVYVYNYITSYIYMIQDTEIGVFWLHCAAW